ncbi:hypothetical protein LCGC14_0469400 [marine sediment metagenome]|uniref:Uncharacterized protein n=1 Tax=marine sediment metagenome TaxID=412755 RepID=A0A0F9SCK7_9ZZZZ
MDTVEELKKHVEVLEKFLKEEKAWRNKMNKVLSWEKERNKVECDALRQLLTNKMTMVENLTGSLELIQNELLALQSSHGQLKEKYGEA